MNSIDDTVTLREMLRGLLTEKGVGCEAYDYMLTVRDPRRDEIYRDSLYNAYWTVKRYEFGLEEWCAYQLGWKPNKEIQPTTHYTGQLDYSLHEIKAKMEEAQVGFKQFLVAHLTLRFPPAITVFDVGDEEKRGGARKSLETVVKAFNDLYDLGVEEVTKEQLLEQLLYS